MAEKGVYETFDSGSGPVIPEGEDGSFAHKDSEEGLKSYTSNKADDSQGSVPEVPSQQK